MKIESEASGGPSVVSIRAAQYATASDRAETSATSATFRPLYAWWVIALVTAAYVLSNIDRQLISILVRPLQQDLNLTDTQFGAVQGVAYGLFYAGCCIPIASLSDRLSRSGIICAGLALWSAATLASGLASNFGQLFLARAVVGIGEASLLPAVYSLIADLFPREQLGRAMGTFSLGPFLGSSGGFLLGAAVLHSLGENGTYLLWGVAFHAWQATFFVAAVPGLILAFIMFTVIRDPRTTNYAPGLKAAPAPFREVIGYIVQRRRVFGPLLIGFPLLVVSLYVMLSWSTAYLIRTEGLSSAQAGVWLGSVALLAGGGGAWAAGFLTDLLVSRRRAAGAFEVGILAATLLSAGVLLILSFHSANAPFAVIIGAIFLGSFGLAPGVVVIQTLVPPFFRSRVSGVYLVLNTLLGQVSASFIVGVLNDHVFPGPQGIGLSLPVFIICTSGTAAIVLFAGRKALAAAHVQLPRHG